jgi:hypothetical protein
MELSAIFAELAYSCYDKKESSKQKVQQYLDQAQIDYPQYKDIFRSCEIVSSTKDFVVLKYQNEIHLCIRGTIPQEKRDLYNDFLILIGSAPNRVKTVLKCRSINVTIFRL